MNHSSKRKAETSSTASAAATKGLHKDKRVAVVKSNTNSPSSAAPQPSQATSSIHNADLASASFDPLLSNLELYRPANRGLKLSVLADHQALNSSTQRPVLWPLVTFTDHIELVSIGKRKVIRKRGFGSSKAGVDIDAYEAIDLQDIWRIPDKYTDLHEIQPIKTTFHSQHLALLSRTLMELVESEFPFLRAMAELSNLLQGDDVRFPAALLQDCLQEEGEEDGIEVVRLVAEEMGAVWNEYVERLQDIRKLLNKAVLQKRDLGKKLNLVPQ